jgi:glycosyltransferase involved in cell wall biosynthesis
VNRTPNELVLQKIAESEILIQASVHEGTGLPLLEAIGVGTIPITSDVGIASEVLTGDLEHLIVDRKEESFEFKIRQVLDSTSDLSSLCISAFDEFIKKIAGEKITWERRETHLAQVKVHLVNAFKVRFIWIYRYFRSKKGY